MKRKVLDQLKVVLDDNGTPRACGRENCKKAIRFASTLYPGMDYGDVESGFMNVEALYLLKKQLEKELEG